METMDYLGKDLLVHFMENTKPNAFVSKATVESFMRKHGFIIVNSSGSKTDFNALERILYYCEKLKNEGNLLFFDNHLKKPFLGNSYVSVKYDSEMADYGGYEFLVQGFVYIQEVFSESVMPVDIIDSEQLPDIGTCFVIGPNLLVTAKHCIKNQHQIKICTKDGASIVPEVIGVFDNDDIDICIIKTKGEPFKNLMFFITGDAETLMEVLTMGYPPIPGFKAIRISDLANIGSALKNSKGNIVGSAKSYLDKLSYFLINSKVKSGNSGSPVIDKYGRLVGIVTYIPLDSEDREKLDGLGYGVAISSEMISRLDHQMKYGTEFKKIPFKNLDGGGFSTLD